MEIVVDQTEYQEDKETIGPRLFLSPAVRKRKRRKQILDS